ncbi:MAG: hypothetical protein ACRC5C_12955, partial [Bacilli bacterium]
MLKPATPNHIPLIRSWLQQQAQHIASKGVNQWRRFLDSEATRITERDYANGELWVYTDENGQAIGAVTVTMGTAWDEGLWGEAPKIGIR